MRALEFDTALLPVEARLPAFRQGARDFVVDALGNLRAFRTQWRLLKLGDVNLIRSTATPIHYRRDRGMIEADGQDRVAIHYRLAGTAFGTLDGKPFRSEPGSASVWDLAHPLDCRAIDTSELIIVTLPRHMLDDVFAVASYSCVVPPGPELELAAGQASHLLTHPDGLNDEGAPFLGRAIRDLFAMALMPALREADGGAGRGSETLLQHLHRAIDANLRGDMDLAALAHRVDAPVAPLQEVIDRAGGLDAVVERRRLLASYQRLSNPEDVTPIALVAWVCGLDDLARFRRRFRALFGVSPNRLRSGMLGGLPRWAGAYPVDISYGPFLLRDDQAEHE